MNLRTLTWSLVALLSITSLACGGDDSEPERTAQAEARSGGLTPSPSSDADADATGPAPDAAKDNVPLDTPGGTPTDLDRLAAQNDSAFDGGLSPATTFFFQAVFAATAVTIASGAMAERTKFSAYLAFSLVMCAFIYPVVVHWTWGGGLIAQMSIGDAVYSDFAGSGIVHMVGGIAGLMGAMFLGPRIGKYSPDGTPRAIPGHNIPFAILGVFILWLGWFGFNPGSELAADQYVMSVAVNTMLAATAGALFSAVTIWLKAGKPDVAMVGNGALAGLVAITAPCGTVDPLPAALIGGIGGIIVVYSVYFFDKVKIDDPVGAVSVHGVCGIWGTLSIGLFAKYDDAFLGREDAGLFYGGGFDQLGMQAVMLLIIIAWVTITTAILFTVIKATIGLRVSAEEETEGLDVLEHGLAGYSGDSVSVGS